MTDPQYNMPRYQCHKKVWAFKIKAIYPDSNGRWWLRPVDEGYGPIQIDPQYIVKHEPVAGGYYVVYDDGYKSFSPAEVFESGYCKIDSESA